LAGGVAIGGLKTTYSLVNLHSPDISRSLGPYQLAQPITEQGVNTH